MTRMVRMVHGVTSPEATNMLVLSRKKDERIMIGDNVSIMIVDIRGDKVRLGIEAPAEISVHRREVYEAIQREQAMADQNISTPSE